MGEGSSGETAGIGRGDRPGWKHSLAVGLPRRVHPFGALRVGSISSFWLKKFSLNMFQENY